MNAPATSIYVAPAGNHVLTPDTDCSTLPAMDATQPLRLGISRCLLGDRVRYDGGHKRDAFLADVLGRFVEWVPVCPEVEAGLSVPREPMRLEGSPESPRLITITTGVDRTFALTRFAERRMRELEALDLSGYVFKKDSPSCGIERVRLYNRRGAPTQNGVGLFAKAFMERFPLIPVEEEGRLNDPVLRENFVERIFCYRRWRNLASGRVTRGTLVAFHTAHKYLLLAHSRPHYEALGRLVASASRYTPAELASRYGKLFMETLALKATVRKHTDVLHHLIGHFINRLAAPERRELLEVISDYHKRLTPLIVPITLIKHYVNLLDISYLKQQVYLNPHPKELMLRNHV